MDAGDMNIKGDMDVDFAEADVVLAGLARSLVEQTRQRRRIRILAQWVALFDRLALVIVATGQASWAWVLTHRATILKLAEEQRQAGEAVNVGLGVLRAGP